MDLSLLPRSVDRCGLWSASTSACFCTIPAQSRLQTFRRALHRPREAPADQRHAPVARAPRQTPSAIPTRRRDRSLLMAKRKELTESSEVLHLTPSKRSRKQAAGLEISFSPSADAQDETSPRKAGARAALNRIATPSKSARAQRQIEIDSEHDSAEEEGESTPIPNGTTLFATPNKRRLPVDSTPTRAARADRSAKRKSAQALLDTQDDESDWDNSKLVAQAILDEAGDTIQSTPRADEETITVGPDSAPVTPSKRSRGRPKGAKNKRSPTPEGDLPPEEKYFFQNRTGPAQVSANSFVRLGLLSHDEYFQSVRAPTRNHESEKTYLTKLHARAFPQWKFELDQGFSVCMYGYGSKRRLMNDLARWLFRHSDGSAKIVVLNGYMARINIRNVLSTIANALNDMKLNGPPHDMLDTILAHLTQDPSLRLVIMVNSIDSSALRRPSSQSLLARLAAHPQVNFVASADTPTFPTLWNSTLKDQFRFAFHDCTTFAPYDVEINPVDDVNELLGRKNRRTGGKEGVGFVLRSLPENARNLYRVLLTEILTVVNDGVDDPAADDEDEDDGDDDEAVRKKPRGGNTNAEDVGIGYRTLYQKASEEFICSSDMNFRFLLKEFHDHQMLTTRRDASGTELLGVPLQRDEMEAVLEDLVLG